VSKSPKVDYYVVQVPMEIFLCCPHCDSEIEFSASDFTSEEIWYGGVDVECPECHGDIILGDAEYE